MNQSNLTAWSNLPGTKPSFAYANYDDCRRYGIQPLLSSWSIHWVKERLKPERQTIGELINDSHGNYFQIYEILKQPHEFHNIVYTGNPLIPWMIPTKRWVISDLSLIPDQLDQVISFRGLQYLGEEHVNIFLKQVEKILRPQGKLTMAVTHFFNLCQESKKVLQQAYPLIKKNMSVPFPGMLSLKRIQSIVPRFKLVTDDNPQVDPGDRLFDEASLGKDDNILKIALDEIFKDQFSDNEYAQLQAAADALITVMGFDLTIDD